MTYKRSRDLGLWFWMIFLCWENALVTLINACSAKIR